MRRLPRTAWGFALVVACGEGDREEQTATSATLSASASAGEEGTSQTSAEGSGSEAASADADTGIKLDVSAMTTGASADDGGGSGCKKVDFLFVIDNSGSMADEQQNLIVNFPSFISTIQETLDDAQDYHIMVIDTDHWVYAGCEMICAFFGNCAIAAPDYVCGMTTPLECEDILGAAVTYPRGVDASNMDCMFSSGARYMDSSEPNLATAFQCAARVGTGSTDDPERPMEAMVQAVSDNTPAAACNTGFLRDDAILVVTFITDEDDAATDGSAGTVDGWHQALVSAKNGDENAVVVLGLFGDNDQPGAICPPFNPDAASGAEPSPRLVDFVEGWGDHGIRGSICAESYADFFLQAVGLIDTTCDEFEPPG
jgi:hypothetical protein